ncbi:MAG: hypothetical protein ACJ8GW_11795 [Massilia sp.]
MFRVLRMGPRVREGDVMCVREGDVMRMHEGDVVCMREGDVSAVLLAA